MEIRGFKLELRQVDETKGLFFGFAALIDTPIPGNRLWHGMDEVILPGAFTKTLQESAGQVPIFDTHDSKDQIGLGVEAVETKRGLEVVGELFINEVRRAAEVFGMIKKHIAAGRPRGISIGFRALQEHFATSEEGVDTRFIEELAWDEYSPVAIPAQVLATATEIRAISSRWKERGYNISEDVLSLVKQAEAKDGQDVKPEELHLILEDIRKGRRGA